MQCVLLTALACTTCLQALCARTGKGVVLKVYDFTTVHDREWSRLKAYREALIHARLRHESIVLLYCAFQVRCRLTGCPSLSA